jgi:two-component sensor histidine kinase
MTSPAKPEQSLSREQRHAILNQLHIASAILEEVQEELNDPQQRRRLESAFEAVWRAIDLIRQTKSPPPDATS